MRAVSSGGHMSAVTIENLQIINQCLSETLDSRSHHILMANKPSNDSINLVQLDSILAYLSADIPAGSGNFFDPFGHPTDDYWFAVILAGASLGSDVVKERLRGWSQTSDRYDDQGFENSYARYDSSHPQPLGYGSLVKFARVRGWEDVEQNRLDSLIDSNTNFGQQSELQPIPSSVAARDSIRQFSVTGQSRKLREQMLADIFVLKGIAILGQWTTIYGAPNSGKTLISQWLLREASLSDLVDGESVYYVNADDNYRGLVEKIELAEEWGMHVLAPHHNNFKVNDIPELMSLMANDGSAQGTIIVLDTLKKFTDLMDKRAASEFGVSARGYVSAGGTLIALAHTNKHAGADGKSVYSGTSDIVDDSDCCFVINKVCSTEDGGKTTETVEFSNIKARGDVLSEIGFTFSKERGQSYRTLLDSVVRLDRDTLEVTRSQSQLAQELEEDAPVIQIICELISKGVNSKDQLIKEVRKQTEESANRIRKLIDKRTGEVFDLGHRWREVKGAHNKSIFSVLAPSDN
jgi:archaellum biogenesis ATPase FlaH